MSYTPGVSSRLITAVAASLAFCWSISIAAEDKLAETGGFLDAKLEARLKETRLDSGRKVERWLSSELNAKNYSAVMVDRATFYPAPHPGPEVSSSTLTAIADHLTYTLKTNLGDSLSVVDKAGPGVLRIQPAFTSLTVSKEGMSAVDVLPVALLFHAAKSGSGKSSYESKVSLEVRVTDSMSGANRAGVKMVLEGKKLDKGETLSLSDVQDILDTAAKDGADSLIKALQ